MAARNPASAVRRIFRLWRIYAVMDFLVVARDLKTFLMWYVSDLMLSVASVTGMLLLAARFEGIGAWSKLQVVFMLGYAALVGGIVSTFFSYNIVMISRRLGRGQLDHTLIQPQPLWISLLTEGFSPAFGSATLLPGIVLMLWAGARLPLALTPGRAVLLIVSLAASSGVVLAFQFLWGSMAFWSPRAAEEISTSTMTMLDQLKPFPLDGLGGMLAGGLLTVVPAGFVAWYPCRVLLGLDRAPMGVWVTPLAALALCALAAGVFRQGMKHYGRTGSQRYTDFGHRR